VAPRSSFEVFDQAWPVLEPMLAIEAHNITKLGELFSCLNLWGNLIGKRFRSGFSSTT
jgi:hypothetical protein